MKTSASPASRAIRSLHLLLFFALSAHAQLSLTVLHSFRGGSDGQQPYAGLVQTVDGFLYGTTYLGGTNNAGTIYRVRPDGSGNTPIFNFENSKNNPFGLSYPSGLIQGADGALYGTTGHGGPAGAGSVFRIGTDGSGYAVLHNFSPPGGYQPSAGVIQGRDGTLFGTTQFGGVGAGAVFKISTNGADFAVIYLLGLSPGAPQSPQAPLLQGADGALYGTTTAGGDSAVGGASGYGTVFKVQPDGSGAGVLHSFLPSDGDGARPYGVLVQGTDGLIYGTTQEGGSLNGGSGYGTVFRLKPDGSDYRVLHRFNSKPGTVDATYPVSGLVVANDGALYGSGLFGGASNLGAIFTLRPNGSGYSLLYEFGSSSGDGAHPQSPLVRASGGGLFGTAQFGGQGNSGVIYRLAPAPTVISSLNPLPNGMVQIAISGAPHFEYRIEGSTNHAEWVPLTNIYNASGTMHFTDPESSKFRTRFYRGAWVP
jgi:uncharacterized repeat protein (TIGR03803 family)